MRNGNDIRAGLSLLLAIIGIIWGFLFILGPIAAMVFGVIGFVLGYLSRKDRGICALNFGGMIFGIISILLGIVTMLYNNIYLV